MSLNKVILIGRLGADPEMSFTAGGQAKSELRIATSRSYRAATGEIKEQTEWHDVVVWGKQAEVVAEHAGKGALLQVEGRLQTRSWQAQDGSRRYRTEVVAETPVQFLSRPGRQSERASAPSRPQLVGGSEALGAEVARENALRYRNEGSEELAHQMERMAEQLEQQAEREDHVIER